MVTGHADIVATLLQSIEPRSAVPAAIDAVNRTEGRGVNAMVAAINGRHNAVAEILAAAGGAVPTGAFPYNP